VSIRQPGELPFKSDGWKTWAADHNAATLAVCSWSSGQAVGDTIAVA
jgi:hypothetical protein